MQRYAMDAEAEFGQDAWAVERKSNTGAWVRYDDAQAELARLTAERDEARATAAAAYEMAARRADEDAADRFDEKPDYGSYYSGNIIRALATEAETNALAEMLDAETRACAQIVRDNGMSSMAGEKAILARLDQRKEAGEE